MVGGAARGAAGGAMKGAIAGGKSCLCLYILLAKYNASNSYQILLAILPGMDAGDGAKAGAAVGATTGGLRGIRGRRAARRGF